MIQSILIFMLFVTASTATPAFAADFYNIDTSINNLADKQLSLFNYLQTPIENFTTLASIRERNQVIQLLNRVNERLFFIATNRSNEFNIQLNVPFYRQEKPLSCEIAALRMALNYYGANLQEKDLKDTLPWATPYQYENGLWGDPDVGFVGDISGNQVSKTGYGVYWKPIAYMAQYYLPQSYYFENESIDEIVYELNAGHPVLAWSVYAKKGKANTMNWQTPEGKDVVAFVGEHTFVIKGFIGSLNKPQYFIVQNPLSGTVKVSVKSFANLWSKFNYSGVVIR